MVLQIRFILDILFGVGNVLSAFYEHEAAKIQIGRKPQPI